MQAALRHQSVIRGGRDLAYAKSDRVESTTLGSAFVEATGDRRGQL